MQGPGISDLDVFATALNALGAWDVAVAELDLVSRSENFVVRLATKSGTRYALRIHRANYHCLAELESERLWTLALNESGVNVPVPRPTRTGAGYVKVPLVGTNEQSYVGMIEWIDGKLLADVLEKAPASMRISYFEQVGEIAAAIHDHAGRWRLPAGFKRHALNADGLMSATPYWGRFWEAHGLEPGQRAVLKAARAFIHSRLCEYGEDPDRYGLIHADLHPQNLLVHDKRLCAIDFDDSGFGWHLYEIAVALRNHQRDRDFSELRDALIRGYRNKRQLDDGELALLPMFSLIRTLALLGWFKDRTELRRSEYYEELVEEACVGAAEIIGRV